MVGYLDIMQTIIAVIFWFGLATMFGLWSKARGNGFLTAFLIACCFGPIVATIAILLKKSNLG